MKRIVLVLLFFYGTCMAQENFSTADKEAARSVMASMIEKSKNQTANKAALNVNKIAQSKEFQQKQAMYSQELKGLFGRSSGDEEQDKPTLVNDQFVMFVSSSMPIQTLRAYARDLSKVGGVMVVRGGVGGVQTMMPTLKWSRSVLKADPSCSGIHCKMFNTQILVDPILFSLYKIKHVPALIYQEDMKIASYCDGLEDANVSKNVVYGDAYMGRMIKALSDIDEGDERLLKYAAMLGY